MRFGFAVKVLGGGGLPSHHTRAGGRTPTSVSLDHLEAILGHLEAHGIGMYRTATEPAPYASHPDHPGLRDQPRACAARLVALGVPHEFGPAVPAGDVAAAVIGHLCCGAVGGAIGVLFSPPRLTRRATAIAAVIPTLLLLVAVSAALARREPGRGRAGGVRRARRCRDRRRPPRLRQLPRPRRRRRRRSDPVGRPQRVDVTTPRRPGRPTCPRPRRRRPPAPPRAAWRPRGPTARRTPRATCRPRPAGAPGARGTTGRCGP
jgi:hypothetical protein